MTGAMATRSPAADIRSFVRITPTSLLLAGFLRIIDFLQPRAAQDVAHRVISFVARVLVHQLVGRRPGVLTRPWSSPCLRVFDRKPVEQGLRIAPREALDDV